MLSGLMLTAFLMGLGGIPHCAAMCGAACAAALPRGVPPLALVGRCLGYAALGSVAAASASLLAQWGRQVSVLQPFWVLLQAMAVVAGAWLLFTGHMPQALERGGQRVYWRLRGHVRRVLGETRAVRWRSVWPLLAGLAWAAVPCGLLYAALMVAALAPSAIGGAAVMLSFALPSALGVWAAPAVLTRLVRRAPMGGQVAAPVIWLAQDEAAMVGDAHGACQPDSPHPSGAARASVGAWAKRGQALFDPRWAVRASGLCLSAMAVWGLSHHLMAQWQAWCA